MGLLRQPPALSTSTGSCSTRTTARPAWSEAGLAFGVQLSEGQLLAKGTSAPGQRPRQGDRLDPRRKA